jgi:hypothetical protein
MHLSRSALLKAILAILVALVPFSPGILPQEKSPEPPPTRVLFIGNSYTYFNNLPEIFTQLAVFGRQDRIETRMVAPGGWRLKDHWEQGETRRALRERKWNYVVLQEQSMLGISFFLDGRPRVSSDEVFRPYARKWAAEVRKAGAIPIFYLTWARKANPEDQAALNYIYMRAARENGAQVAPVGIVWAQVREQQPILELYVADGSHPSPAGSYLAACTLYATIFHQSPAGLPGRIAGFPINYDTAKVETDRLALLVDLPMDLAQSIQNAAWTAWQQLQENGGYLDLNPVPVPAPAPLPSGMPLSAADLEGTWSGDLLFYSPPSLPSEMVLELHRKGSSWKGHLQLHLHSKDQTDRSFDLVNLHVGGQTLTFTDPKGMQDRSVQYRGVCAQPGELRGTAEAVVEQPDFPVRRLGSWQLHKKKP